MILYRLATEPDDSDSLPEPPRLSDNRNSSSGESVITLSYDSKYPAGSSTRQSAFIPYAFDPWADAKDEPEDDDYLYEPGYGDDRASFRVPSWRGLLNVTLLVSVITALIALFICYPVVSFYRGDSYNRAINANAAVNGTGQAASIAKASTLFPLRDVIDPDTPQDARTRTGFDGQPYVLVFSDEFNTDGRSFYPGDDPYWEAADLWYGATNDLEWYAPEQVTTAGGALHITLEQVDPGAADSHALGYRSGMLQSWNKFCFSGGYIEVALTLPGPDSDTQGYWPAAWTLGNLGRAGYRATTDGTWPYSYDTCDVGTFPNQTWANGTGPAAALHSDASKEQYDYELSWLPGQRLSACTCAGEDHPGPDVARGRGAPEIDILEAERNKTGRGQVVSQSAQFAPFNSDYAFDAQGDAYTVYDAGRTRANGYRGSPLQQAVSALTDLPDDMFQGSGQVFTTLGFEYWTDPARPQDGFITWQTAGEPSATMRAPAVGPDAQSMIGQRLVSEEPMSIVLNLGLSHNWQDIDPATMLFPAAMLVDYVRVYQRANETNVGCSPAAYPTAEYIAAHMDAYSNPNLTSWAGPGPASAGYSWPKNALYEGGC